MDRRTLLKLAGLPCLASVPAFSQNNKTLQISTLLEQDPDTITVTRILNEAYRKLGLTLNVNYLPGERSIRSANNGELDGELYRKIGLEKEYPNLIIVPVPLLTYEVVIFTRGTQFIVNGWESLRPYTVGYVKGIKIVEQNISGLKTESTATMRQAFLKMSLGRSDVVVANHSSGLAVLKEMKMTGVTVMNPPLVSLPMFHYLHKKHEALVPKLHAILLQMQKDKTIENIQKAVRTEQSEKIGTMKMQ